MSSPTLAAPVSGCPVVREFSSDKCPEFILGVGAPAPDAQLPGESASTPPSQMRAEALLPLHCPSHGSQSHLGKRLLISV